MHQSMRKILLMLGLERL